MSDSETYEIFALKYAERTNRKRVETFIRDDEHNSPHPIDYFVWVIRNDNRTIVVDTGYDSKEAARRSQPIIREPREALAIIDVDAGAVEQAIITHFHYDHAGSLGQFGAARFHIQEAEMVFATGPCMCPGHMQKSFTADHVCQMVQNVYSGRVEFHDGDAAIAPGITVHKIGGHSRGLQCVRVITKRGWVVVASDAAHFYENFEQRKPYAVVVDVADMIKGFKRLYELADSPDHIVPGHDPLVLERYPPFRDNLRGIVHRIDVAPAK